MRKKKLLQIESHELKAAAAFFVARLVLILSLPLEGLRSYGDLWNFFGQAKLGLPFVTYWTEFPPVFPWISTVLYQISGDVQHRYDYLAILLFSFIQAVNVFLILKIASLMGKTKRQINTIGLVYAGLTIGLFYTWAYFDVIAVCAMLAGVYFLFLDKPLNSACWIALGALTKWFPFILIPGIWKTKKRGSALKISVLAGGIVVLIWASLFAVNPEMSAASLQSQAVKGSWETIWALLDGNLGTGNFPDTVNRLDPASIGNATQNKVFVQPWISFILFAGFGLYLLVRSNLDSNTKYLSFSGLAFMIFLIWSPGYSPQWTLYLLPFILLVLPEEGFILFGTVLVLINLVEWPLLLSRASFGDLFWLIPVRMLVLMLLGIKFFQYAGNERSTNSREG